MTERTESIQSLDDLRRFIHTSLCDRENLVAEQFQMREMTLVVRGRNCGMQFSLKGPRSVRLGAIWAADQNMLYLYDARGERYGRVSLPQRVYAERTASRSAGLAAPADVPPRAIPEPSR
jgi:hypothetical protein